MTQPTFVPVTDSGAVRPTVPTSTPEIGRAKKAGLLGSPSVHGRTGRGTPGPDGGYALTLAHRAVHECELSPGESVHDIEVGVALLAAKRAALVGRGPTGSDVTVALDLFCFRSEAPADVLADRQTRFSGVGHSYFVQREFVDAVADEALRQTADAVTALVRFAPAP